MSTIAHAESHLNDGDQTQTAPPQPTRFEEGVPNSHLATDSKDQRSIANKLAAEEAKEKEQEEPKLSPTQIAESHGNKPSRGAKIDERIEQEEREELERKGKV